MNTGYFTLTQMVTAKLLADKARLDSSRIQDIIARDLGSSEKHRMAEGENYYAVRHDILDNKNLYYIDGVATEDLIKANSTLPHPFHKILVDQKCAYIVGNPIVLSIAEPDIEDAEELSGAEQSAIDAADEYEEALHDLLGNDFDDLVNDWIKGASNKGVEWVHFYVNPEGELEFVVCPAGGIIPVYDSQYQDDLLYVIRFYTYELIDESGQAAVRYKVEWWSKEGVEYWAQTVEQNYILDTDYQYNPAAHWYTFNTKTPSVKEPHTWGVVPFVPLYNNTEGTTDLEPIKALIDAYDKVASGWCNDLVDFQELIYVLKGYAAVSSEMQKGMSELGIFMQNLKTHKVISVEADGAVETLKAEIPVEAKEKFLAITRKAIFYFGQGVDVDTEKFGDPSGIALKFLYAGLDLKANVLIRKLKDALSEFMYFVVEYLNRDLGRSWDYEEVIFTMNKALIFNEKEKIDECIASEGMLSKRTVLEHHPFVDDVEEEMARLEADERDKVAKAMVSLEDIAPDGTRVEPDGSIVPPPRPIIAPAPAGAGGGNGNGKGKTKAPVNA